MNVAVDAMGGDNAPAAVVHGAAEAGSELGIDITLVGDREVVNAELASRELMDRLAVPSASCVLRRGRRTPGEETP